MRKLKRSKLILEMAYHYMETYLFVGKLLIDHCFSKGYPWDLRSSKWTNKEPITRMTHVVYVHNAG